MNTVRLGGASGLRPTFSSPLDRARDAQIDLFRFLAGEKRERAEFGDKLSSVFATAEMAKRQAPMGPVAHKGWAETHTTEFAALEARMWRFVEAGAMTIAIFEMATEELLAHGFPAVNPKTIASEALRAA